MFKSLSMWDKTTVDLCVCLLTYLMKARLKQKHEAPVQIIKCCRPTPPSCK
jgi:hypothetical protein